MAKSIATVHGIALRPGVSRNGRLYTKELIASAVARAQPRISAGGLDIVDRTSGTDAPLSQLTHHAAEDDSTRIVGRLTGLRVAEDGSAEFDGELADTPHGRTIFNLIDTSDGRPAFLRGVSIRGAWRGRVRLQTGPEGGPVETADDLELDGLDYTRTPGVVGAEITSVTPHQPSGARETASDGRTPIYESVEEARVTTFTDSVADTPEADTAPPTTATEAEPTDAATVTESTPPAAPTAGPSEATVPPALAATMKVPGGGPYADPGYQADKKKRYPIDTKKRAKAAWGYINQSDNAKLYTTSQLKRIKQRIAKALKGFGVEVNTSEGYLVEPVEAVNESLAEGLGLGRSDGSFCINLTNGPVCVTVSSYCVDPADLDLVGRAAMDGACKALAALDPDMDGDIDVPGADDEDTDHDKAQETAPPAPAAAVAETAPAPSTSPALSAPGNTPQPTDSPADAGEDEETAVADATQAAAETAAPTTTAPTPAVPAATETAPAAAQPVMSAEQFAQFLAALRPAPPVESAPAPAAPPVAETAPAAVTETEEQRVQRLVAETVSAMLPTPPAAAPAPEPVAETEEQRITRLVAEGVKAALPGAVQEYAQANPPARKGIAEHRGAASYAEPAPSPGEGVDDLPEGWPQKPLHLYTREERQKYMEPTVAGAVLGDRRKPQNPAA